MRRSRPALAALALGLTTLLAYWPATRLEFTADDFLVLDHLARLESLHDIAAYFELNFYAYYRPLAFVSFAVDSSVWGTHAGGFHLTNIVLHAVNTALVYVLGRRLGDGAVAGVAAIVFALAPAGQEGIFWISGRFDLLATAGILAALVMFWSPRRSLYWIGLACFGLALLAKESAAAVVMLAAAYGVLVERRDWRWALRHLAPVLVISALYVFARSAAGLSPVGGAERLGKVAMLVAVTGGVVWLSMAGPPLAPRARRQLLLGLLAGVAAGAVLTLAVLVPGIGTRLGPSLGFATYAAYWLGPLGFLPGPEFLDPNRASWVVGGVAGASLLVALAVAVFPWLRQRPAMLLSCVFIGAALVPVSAMPGRTHLYLASVGVALLSALAIQRVPRPAFRAIVVIAVVAAGAVHLAAATRRWQQASAMTRGAVALVTAHPAPCAERDIVLLTAPSGVDDIPCNLNYETFKFLGACVPRVLHTMLRVVREDATVQVSRPSPAAIELRVVNYRGNIVASEDLRNYRVQVRHGRTRATLDTPIGRVEMWPDGTSQVFRVTLNEEASRATFYYYSGRQLHAVPAPATPGRPGL